MYWLYAELCMYCVYRYIPHSILIVWKIAGCDGVHMGLTTMFVVPITTPTCYCRDSSSWSTPTFIEGISRCSIPPLPGHPSWCQKTTTSLGGPCNLATTCTWLTQILYSANIYWTYYSYWASSCASLLILRAWWLPRTRSAMAHSWNRWWGPLWLSILHMLCARFAPTCGTANWHENKLHARHCMVCARVVDIFVVQMQFCPLRFSQNTHVPWANRHHVPAHVSHAQIHAWLPANTNDTCKFIFVADTIGCACMGLPRRLPVDNKYGSPISAFLLQLSCFENGAPSVTYILLSNHQSPTVSTINCCFAATCSTWSQIHFDATIHATHSYCAPQSARHMPALQTACHMTSIRL